MCDRLFLEASIFIHSFVSLLISISNSISKGIWGHSEYLSPVLQPCVVTRVHTGFVPPAVEHTGGGGVNRVTHGSAYSWGDGVFSADLPVALGT